MLTAENTLLSVTVLGKTMFILYSPGEGFSPFQRTVVRISAYTENI